MVLEAMVVLLSKHSNTAQERKLSDHNRPNHFIEVSKVLGSSAIHDIYIENYPVHCFSISGSAGVDIYHITLNNSAGYAPNERSNGLSASHNSDGMSHSLHDMPLY
jgi:hypothetical protein